MTAARLDLICEQGASFEVTAQLVLDDPDQCCPTTQPQNLTGFTAAMQVRPTSQSTDMLIELTTENGRIVLGGAAGTVQLMIAPIDTAALPVPVTRDFPQTSVPVYDLFLTSPTGETTKLFLGLFTVVAEVTRS